jgi:hypothetical protein
MEELHPSDAITRADLTSHLQEQQRVKPNSVSQKNTRDKNKRPIEQTGVMAEPGKLTGGQDTQFLSQMV